jgi:hypothetical protein
LSAPPRNVAGALVHEPIAEAPGASLLDTSEGALLWLPGRRRDEKDEDLLAGRLEAGARSWAWVLGRAPGLAVRLSLDASEALSEAAALAKAFGVPLELGEEARAKVERACERAVAVDRPPRKRTAVDTSDLAIPDEAVEVPLLADPGERPAPVAPLTTPRPRRRLALRILLWGLAGISILAVVIALTLVTNPAARALVRGFPWRARLKRLVRPPVHVPDLLRLELDVTSGVLSGVSGPKQLPREWMLCDEDFLCLKLDGAAGRFKAAEGERVTIIGVMPSPVIRWPATGRVTLDWEAKGWIWHQVDQKGARWPLAKRVVTPGQMEDFLDLVKDSPPWHRPTALTFWGWNEDMRPSLKELLALEPEIRAVVSYARPRAVVRGVWATEGVRHIVALGQRVENLDFLHGDPGPVHLILWGSRTSDISKLGSCSRLRVLDLTATKVADIAPLSRCKKLEVIGLQSTNVEDLSPLAGLPRLRKLYLGGSKVRDISPLASCPALQDLELAQTEVSDLRPLLDMPALEWAYIRGVPAEVPEELKGRDRPRVVGEPEGPGEDLQQPEGREGH